MTNLKFPYEGNQLLITSDRVILHSKKDSILLLGKSSVGISTPKTFNVDAQEGAIIFSPKIKLGKNANERILLGETTLNNLKSILSSLQNLCEALSNISESNFSSSVPVIRNRADILKTIINDKLISIEENLSNVTYSE